MPQILSRIERNGEPERTLDQARLTRFARATGLRDRSRHRPWLSDVELEHLIRGYAYAVATAEQFTLALGADDIGVAIRTYRRARRLAPRADRSQPALLTVVGTAP